jgi:hypothetical protein
MASRRKDKQDAGQFQLNFFPLDTPELETVKFQISLNFNISHKANHTESPTIVDDCACR